MLKAFTRTTVLTGLAVFMCVVSGAATVFAQSFATPVNYTVGSNPFAAAHGDFNGDGKHDLAVANNSTNNISVLLGNGDGAFGAKTDYDVGQPAYGVVATDLNSDGKLDLAVETSFSLTESVSVLLGNGDGTFQPRVDHSFSGLAQPNSILASDFNNDSKTDLVVVNGSGATVFLGNGDGTLNPPANFGGSNFATSVAVGDFNADGKIDLAVSSYGFGVNGVISVMLGKGDGTFFPSVNYSSAPSPFSIVKGDFNGDGKLDLATANIQVNNVSILLGNGDGSFQTFVNYATEFTYQLSIGDLNNDGKSDLVVAGNAFGLSVLKGNGDGTFQKSVNFHAGGRFPTILDLNGDTKPDIVSGGTSTAIAVLLNQTGPHSITGFTRDNNGAALSGVVVSLTGGATVATNSDATGAYAFNDLTAGQTYTVTPVKTNYTFAPTNQVFSNLSSNLNADFVGTLNSHSISGLVRDSFGNGMSGVTVTLSGAASGTITTGSNGSYAFANLAAGQNYTLTPSLPKFMFTPLFANITSLSSNRVINFTGRVATFTISGGVINFDNGVSSIDNFTMVLTGTRSGTTTTNSFGYSFSGLPIDGNYTVRAYAAPPTALFTHFLLLPPFSRSVVALSSNVTANFSAKRLGFSTGNLNPLGIARGDLNGDGKQDVVVATTTGTNIHVLMGNGDGTLQSEVAYLADGTPAAVAIADFDGDGKLDVVSANFGGQDVSVFIGNGDGTLKSRVNYSTGSGANNLSIADFNVDGRLDIATLGSPNTLSVLLGNGNGTFQTALTRTIATAVFSVLSGDLNGDGKQDLVTLGFPGSMLVLLGRGDGTFENPVSYFVGGEVVKATLGDFNNDGKIDAAVTTRFPDGVKALLGRGDGTFQTAINTGIPTEPADLIAQDFDGDGQPDLAVAGSSGGLGFLSGKGDGTFAPIVFYQSPGHSGALVAADFNNDGKLDISVVSQGNDEVNILLNTLLTRTPDIQLNSLNYSIGEGDGHVRIMVTRGGDTTGAVAVEYRTVDSDTFTFGCSETANNLGAAYGRCDFATVVGTISFSAGETMKAVDVPILDDSYAEGNESFSVIFGNPTGAILVTPSNATVTINDNEAVNGVNPILQANDAGIAFFVRQHYLDFLGREPEPGEPWSAILRGCSDQFNVDPTKPAAGCDRITVSGAFFGSPEFKDKGVFVIDFYRASFNRLPLYEEFVTDLASLVGATAPEVFAKRAAFANNFTQRTEFMSIYGSLSNSAYVSALMAGSQMQSYNLNSITTPDPDNPDDTIKVTLTASDLTNRLNAGALTRGQVLRAIVQSDEVVGFESLNAFVGSQYYGYLRRRPDTGGFNSWIDYLSAHPGDFRTMVHGFMNSQEYRLRFGPP